MSLHILQSHPEVIPSWVRRCTASVAAWAREIGASYECIGDELFDDLPPNYRSKVAQRGPILADLARLQVMAQRLADHQTVIWCDADLLIWAPFKPLGFDDAMFSQEIWIQQDGRRWRTHRNVHNAFCGFTRNSVTLPFLTRVTRRIIEAAEPTKIAPQMVGPKLLTSLHSLAGFDVDPRVGALSDAVQADLLADGGPALERLYQSLGDTRLVAANLCASMDLDRREEVCERLLSRGSLVG